MKQAKSRPSLRSISPAALLSALAAMTALSSVVLPVSSQSAAVAADGATASQAVARARPAVVSSRIIGHSVKGRPLRAFELGERSAEVTAVIVGRQHGDEPAGETILESLRDGAPIKGIHLWVVPRANPDGAIRGTRQNARGVDLNRNWPRRWQRVTGYYDSGRKPASEPETRGLKRFLNRVDPRYVVNIHTPLYGLDVTGAKDRPFARRLSRELNLPNHHLTCRGGCHGTMSDWFNYRHRGACVTIEFGSQPSYKRLTVTAPRGLLRALGGHR
jgi:protein MpaA